MSKVVRQQFIQTIELLQQGTQTVKKLITENRSGDTYNLLEDCQQLAIAFGTRIEKLYGEGTSTVSALETYCEKAYETGQNLQNPEQASEAYQSLWKQSVEVEEIFEQEFPDKKEVVFFPYKASMWDSLESVYLAAKEDPNCDAYCVPIPYYDRNPDQSLGQMHYEGNEYPENIEITDWQTYHFEERKPDVIYIHNPYDDVNLVTCVHPRYFSSNLKKYTDKLVYIPYFVLTEMEPTDQVAIDGMKHFIWTPGVVNADQVIVQSENMKQIYVNEYLKAAKKSGLHGKHVDRTYLEQKILGLGSPKFDKVQNTKKEELDIPEDWLRIIQKPDGSWKKIIFYNTSINALLEHNEEMLEKMKDVFRIFKENKDEVALLWRPHPLIQTTVTTMRPTLWTEYEKIVNRYKEEGWGIYDDSSDLDRAVVLSDGYYGDWSSVVRVYQKTEKPVMIQDVGVRGNREDKKDYIWTHGGFAIDGDCVWFVPYWENILCRYNMNTHKTEKTILFPNIKKLAAGVFNVIKRGNYVVSVPAFEQDLYIYNDKEGIMKQYELKRGSYVLERFYCCTNWGDSIYMFPVSYDSILKIELGKDQISDIVIPDIKGRTFVNFEQIKSKVYLVDKTNTILVFDMKSETGQLLKWGEKNRTYMTIRAVGDNKFALTDEEGYLFFYDEGEDEEYRFEYGCETMIKDTLVIKDTLYLFPFALHKPVVKINLHSYEIEKLYFSENKNYRQWLPIAFSIPKVQNDKIYVMHTNQRCLYVLDNEGKQLEHMYMEMGELDNETKDSLYRVAQREGLLNENDAPYATLKYYFSRI